MWQLLGQCQGNSRLQMSAVEHHMHRHAHVHTQRHQQVHMPWRQPLPFPSACESEIYSNSKECFDGKNAQIHLNCFIHVTTLHINTNNNINNVVLDILL